MKKYKLAIALAKNGNCYIFDEPDAGIDLWSFEKLGTIFEKNKTYLVVSHQEKLLKKADKILIMKNGKIEKFGNAKTILKCLNSIQCKRISGGGNGVK